MRFFLSALVVAIMTAVLVLHVHGIWLVPTYVLLVVVLILLNISGEYNNLGNPFVGVDKLEMGVTYKTAYMERIDVDMGMRKPYYLAVVRQVGTPWPDTLFLRLSLQPPPFFKMSGKQFVAVPDPNTPANTDDGTGSVTRI